MSNVMCIVLYNEDATMIPTYQKSSTWSCVFGCVGREGVAYLSRMDTLDQSSSIVSSKNQLV